MTKDSRQTIGESFRKSQCSAFLAGAAVALGLFLAAVCVRPAIAQYDNNDGIPRGGGANPDIGGGGGCPMPMAYYCYDEHGNSVPCDCTPVYDICGNLTGYDCPTVCYNGCHQVVHCPQP